MLEAAERKGVERLRKVERLTSISHSHILTEKVKWNTEGGKNRDGRAKIVLGEPRLRA